MAAHLSIFSNKIRMLDGLFSLNDLHNAAGGEKRHLPAQYLRLQQTQELIAEINRYADLHNAINIKRGGTNQGTWVCKELVYSYAMWISPEFYLKVIHTYDQVTSEPQPDQVIGSEGMKRLSSLVDGKISHLKGKQRASAKSRLWAQVRKAYGVDVAADIPADQLDSARQFVGSYVLEGDYLPAEPQQVAMPLEVTAFSPKRMPSEFDRRHGRLAAEQLHDCGWNLDLLWAVKWLKEHEGQTVRLEPGIADQLSLELNSVLYWYESYRNRLSSIYQEAKIAAPRSALIR
ncbi:KilA-N domain-containing protein [Oceanospirillum beijerinckii]|uniref:KilA-N domain-containing protein n=1 Tax=Oceanospirillum beijerinckii TaxID=64976 RepID=UPI000424E54B|nr:KilA-N domain-containing protein [Oceanospirillum beijerinckii]